MSTTPSNPKVFLSHSEVDNQHAAAVAESFKTRGADCFYAKRDIQSSENYGEEIVKALSDCNIFVLLLSPTTLISDHVRREVTLAVENRIRIFPFGLDGFDFTRDTASHPQWKYWLSGVQVANYLSADHVVVRALDSRSTATDAIVSEDIRTYLIVEDDIIKTRAYEKFAGHYDDSDIRFHIVASPDAAIRALNNKKKRAQFAGVIADFELKGRRLDNRDIRIDVPGPTGLDYTISTGLGVLDWVHTEDPDMLLWSLTDVSATHAPLFMTAASLWLNARPLSVERLYKPDSPLGDRLLQELEEPANFRRLNPTWAWIDAAQAALHQLLNTSCCGEEAFDWLNALTHLHGSTDGFLPSLTRAMKRITHAPDLEVDAPTLAPAMAKWQLRLDEIYQDFSVDRKLEAWPKFDEDDLPRDLGIWSEFNPIMGFLGMHSECQEFFESVDVRMALSNWRSRGEKP